MNETDVKKQMYKRKVYKKRHERKVHKNNCIKIKKSMRK